MDAQRGHYVVLVLLQVHVQRHPGELYASEWAAAFTGAIDIAAFANIHSMAVVVVIIVDVVIVVVVVVVNVIFHAVVIVHVHARFINRAQQVHMRITIARVRDRICGCPLTVRTCASERKKTKNTDTQLICSGLRRPMGGDGASNAKTLPNESRADLRAGIGALCDDQSVHVRSNAS